MPPRSQHSLLAPLLASTVWAGICVAGTASPPVHLQTQVACNHTASEVLVFVHGWPDDARVWLPLVNSANTAPLFSQFRCVLITLPVADGNLAWDTELLDFPELISLVADVVDKEATKQSPVTLVGHDWGAVLAMGVAQKHSELLRRVVLFDIGVQHGLNLYTPFIVGYQIVNIALYLLGRLWSQPADFLNGIWRSLLVGRDRDYDRPKGAALNYFYRHFLRFLLDGFEDAQTAARQPKMPLLFLYGMDMFHDAPWAESLNHTEGCSAQKAGDDHYFFIDRPVHTANLLLSWMSGRGSTRSGDSQAGQSRETGEHDEF